MRRALIFVSFKDWRNHKLRAVITLLGVAIGVSTYFALRTVNQALLGSLEATVDRLAGKATLQITAGESGFPEEVLETVRSTAGVTDAAGQILQFCATDLKDKADLLVLGIDPDSEPRLRGYELGEMAGSSGNPLQLLRLPGTIVISAAFAEKEGLAIGDPLTILTPRGKVDLTVLYVIKDPRIGTFYGGAVGIMEIHAAQMILGRSRNIDRIDLISDAQDSVEAVRRRLKDRLAAGLDIQRPQTRGRQVEDATLIIRQGFLLTSLIALLISAFLIFNAMSIAVNQRWKEIGVLRALGVERAGIRNMFLYEATLIGLLGSGLGIVAGYCMALGFSHLTGRVANVMSASMPSSMVALITTPEPPRFSIGFAVEGLVVGVVVAVISAWLPARAASRLNPILALHNLETRQREAVIGWPRVAMGMTLLCLGLALIRFSTPRVGMLVQLGYFALIFFGLIVMLPSLSCWIAIAMRRVAGRAFGSEGTLAIDSILVAPRRTSTTVGALMVGLAFVFSMWAFIQSEKEVLLNSFERGISADMNVWGASWMTEDLAARIAAIPGIKSADRGLFTTTRYRDQMVALSASEMDKWLEPARNTLSAGDSQKARQLMPRGEGVLISDIFAARSGLRVGDVVGLETPTARLERPVLGIVDSKAVAWLEGVIYMDRQLYKEYWHDNRVHWLAIDLNPGADPADIKSQIEGIAANGQPLFVETSAESRRRGKEIVGANLEQFFRFFYVQMFIAAFVAVIGIVNTLVISVWDRRREIGIIRAVGGLRRQVAKMVLLEAAAIGLIGMLTGVVKGVLDTYFMSRTAAAVFGGYSVPVYLPAVLILVSLPVVMAVALAAAWWPARVASRTNVVAAIGAE